jgi:hypothetical protein
VHADGRAFRGGVPILDSTVSATNVSWSVPNGSNGNITFRPRSDNACIWGPSIREGPLFEGLGGPALQGIQFPGEGWLDFRGARTCVPTTTCAGVCGAMFDGCSQVVCPMVLYSDATERYMDANCFDYLLPRTMSVKGATATTMAVTQDGSWAWVYFYSAWPHEPPSPVGYIETTPANYGRVRVTKEFNPPIQVNSVRICSWWQDARLLGLELLGDQAACTR